MTTMTKQCRKSNVDNDGGDSDGGDGGGNGDGDGDGDDADAAANGDDVNDKDGGNLGKLIE